MIRIKVIPLRKIIYKIEIILAYLAFLIVMLVLISLMFSRKTIIKKEVIGRNLISPQLNFSEEDVINNIVKSKVKILAGIDYDDLGEEKEQDKESSICNNQYVVKDNDFIEKKEDISINIVEYEKWNKPSEYETKLFENGKIQVGSTIISNYSKLSPNLSELKKVSTKTIDENTSFLIFHTHTSETYTINKDEYSDYFRTENEIYNVISVGKHLADALIEKGYNCVHEKKVHDYPSYNGAYKSSLETVEKCLENNNFDFVIDIHRDAISSNENFRPTAEINGESVAKLMFVIGTNSAGLSHDEWMENLKLAIMIQNRANEMYPGLFRELHLSSSRYNQHVSNGAMILEVGATGNTLEEAQGAMKYLANVINSMKVM